MGDLVEKHDLVAKVQEVAARGPEVGAAGAAAPAGFAYDPGSGYWKNADTGMWWDAATGGFYNSHDGKWYAWDGKQYVEWAPAQ